MMWKKLASEGSESRMNRPCTIPFRQWTMDYMEVNLEDEIAGVRKGRMTPERIRLRKVHPRGYDVDFQVRSMPGVGDPDGVWNDRNESVRDLLQFVYGLSIEKYAPNGDGTWRPLPVADDLDWFDGGHARFLPNGDLLFDAEPSPGTRRSSVGKKAALKVDGQTINESDDWEDVARFTTRGDVEFHPGPDVRFEFLPSKGTAEWPLDTGDGRQRRDENYSALDDGLGSAGGDFVGCDCRLKVAPHGTGEIVRQVWSTTSFGDPVEDFVVRLDDGREVQVHQDDVVVL